MALASLNPLNQNVSDETRKLTTIEGERGERKRGLEREEQRGKETKNEVVSGRHRETKRDDEVIEVRG